MASRHSHYITGKPISLKGRVILSLCTMIAATVLGFAASAALYQANREVLRQSDILGHLLCGEGHHVDDVPSRRRARRMICRNAAGEEVGSRNNLIAVKMGLPFIVMFAVPGLLMAWRLDLRETRR